MYKINNKDGKILLDNQLSNDLQELCNDKIIIGELIEVDNDCSPSIKKEEFLQEKKVLRINTKIKTQLIILDGIIVEVLKKCTNHYKR